MESKSLEYTWCVTWFCPETKKRKIRFRSVTREAALYSCRWLRRQEPLSRPRVELIETFEGKGESVNVVA